MLSFLSAVCGCAGRSVWADGAGGVRSEAWYGVGTESTVRGFNFTVKIGGGGEE